MAAVVGALPGQVQASIDQRPAARRRVSQDENRLGVAQFLTDVAAEFRADGGVVPRAGADEVL